MRMTPAADRLQSEVRPGTREGPFRMLYVFANEALSEMRNATVHGFLALALAPRPGGYTLYMAIYVSPVSRLTPVDELGPMAQSALYSSIDEGQPGLSSSAAHDSRPGNCSTALNMVDSEARLALRLTLQEIAEFFSTPSSSRAPAEAAHLLAACVPVLDGLGCPYDHTRLHGGRTGVEHFILRVEGAPEPWTSLLPPTLVATLTDIADYLLHLSRGGKGNYAMENYVSSQCVRLLDQLGIPQAPGNPPA